MSAAYELEDLGEGRYRLSGDMTFATVASILEESTALFEEHTTLTMDLTDVEQSDSAGLALLLEWITWANHTVREIGFKNVPRKLSSIARTSDVEELLTAGERWSGFIE